MTSYVSAALRREVQARAGGICEYCLIHERDTYLGCQVDHVISEKHGGVTEPGNLAFACACCNDRKWAHVEAFDPATNRAAPLFHPRTDRWEAHFEWSQVRPFEIVGKTPTGRATIARLQLNHPELLEIRRELARLGVPIVRA